MKKSIGLGVILTVLSFGLQAQKDKVSEDRKAILAMEGCYKVTFEFAETFSPDTAYQYHDRKFDQGIEQVKVLVNTDKRIVLQHLLVVSDSMVIKHWRQDWVYEPTEIMVYDKDNTWKVVKLSASERKGKWAQKVYQVDDSPRYEGVGTWVHVDGRHFWEAKADAPLPRREYTKRNDYNVVGRFSHMEVTNDGWFLEQDNAKIVRDDNGDRLICMEKGMEKFTKGDFDCKPADEYWAKTENYWAAVREVWSEVYAKNQTLELANKVDGQFLFMALFGLSSSHENMDLAKKEEVKKEILQAIQPFII